MSQCVEKQELVALVMESLAMMDGGGMPAEDPMHHQSSRNPRTAKSPTASTDPKAKVSSSSLSAATLPLHAACKTGDLDLVLQLLTENPSQVDLIDGFGMSPLAWCVYLSFV